MATLLLDQTSWDLVLDASVNLAVAQPPYALAQDAASAIKTFLGEMWLDTTQGVPYLQQVFGGSAPALTQLKQMLVNAALTVPGVAAAQVFITSLSGRGISGQVQVLPSAASGGGLPQMAPFSVANPQGGG